jgi:predicted esterase
MNARLRKTTIGFITGSLLSVGVLLSGCQQSSGKDYMITDFEAVHAPVNGDANAYVIFGNIPVSSPTQDLFSASAGFIGRWEGYDYSPPVKKDYKIVLFIQNITSQGGKAYLWLGTNLQYPSSIQEINFQVIPGAVPAIEFRTPFDNALQTIRLIYDPDKNILRSPDTAHRPIELGRGQSFCVYKDYGRYLGSKQIYAKTYQNRNLQQYGKGFLLYLPDSYADSPAANWPLIFFLHGTGDRGDNVFLLAKASPFMKIREKGSLPVIIAAPLLNSSFNYFPTEYMEGVLAEVQATYRIDPKRIYVTGLSLGGEATYRLAIHQPETFAAIAPLSAALGDDQIGQLSRITTLPVWAIHGADDTIIPLAEGRKPAEALMKLGGNIRFTVLEGHDHDTWTDTYLDTAFYDWLLQHKLP